MNDDQIISSDDFITMVDDGAECLTESEVRFLNDGGLKYRRMNSPEKSDVIVQVESYLERQNLPISGPDMRTLWENNWSDHLQKITSSDETAPDNRLMVPEFIQDRDVVRLNGEYITTRSPEFELHLANLIRKWLFRRYFSGVDWIGDFGAGSGLNLGFLADLFPDTRLRGFDWSDSAVSLINHIGETKDSDVEGAVFDFLNPDPMLVVPPGAGVLTWGALEQVGVNFQPFLSWVRAQNPRVVMHVEPIVDWYDESLELDEIAVRYHHKRGYLSGFWPALQGLELDGEISILKARRLGFGSLFHEVYSVIVWSPRPPGQSSPKV